jgi:hypothetical protein
VVGCPNKLPRGYLTCPTCWRAARRDLKRAWRAAWDAFDAAPLAERRLAFSGVEAATDAILTDAASRIRKEAPLCD